MAPTEEMNIKIEQACQAADHFSKLYYESLDKKRHQMRKLYHESATMVWNGTSKKGIEAIVEFLDLLPTSVTTLSSLDAQPLVEPVVPGENSIMVSVMGKVDFTNNKPRVFQQNFILSSHEKVWKINSDVIRFME